MSSTNTSIPVFSVASAVYYTSDKLSTAILINGLIAILAFIVLFVLSAYEAETVYIFTTKIVVFLSCGIGCCMFVVNCVLRVLAGELMRKAIFYTPNEEKI